MTDLNVEYLRESVRATGNYLSKLLGIDPIGDQVVDALEPVFDDIALAVASGKPMALLESERRLEVAQLNLAAARDAGDRQAMLSAHDAVERAAAEVAGQTKPSRFATGGVIKTDGDAPLFDHHDSGCFIRPPQDPDRNAALAKVLRALNDEPQP